MSREFLLSIAVILLLSSVGFATNEQAQGQTLIAHGHTSTVGHCQWTYSYYYCSTVRFQQPIGAINCQHQVIRWFYRWPCKPVCKPICKPVCRPICKPVCRPICKPVCKPISKPSCKPTCIAIGGDASATANAVSYDGSAQATAKAVGGNAILVIN